MRRLLVYFMSDNFTVPMIAFRFICIGFRMYIFQLQIPIQINQNNLYLLMYFVWSSWDCASSMASIHESVFLISSRIAIKSSNMKSKAFHLKHFCNFSFSCIRDVIARFSKSSNFSSKLCEADVYPQSIGAIIWKWWKLFQCFDVWVSIQF